MGTGSAESTEPLSEAWSRWTWHWGEMLSLHNVDFKIRHHRVSAFLDIVRPLCQLKLTRLNARMKNRLCELRAKQGLSQAELGGRVGVSRQAINLVENGKHDPSLSLAFAISRVFGLPVDAIFVEE